MIQIIQLKFMKGLCLCYLVPVLSRYLSRASPVAHDNISVGVLFTGEGVHGGGPVPGAGPPLPLPALPLFLHSDGCGQVLARVVAFQWLMVAAQEGPGD